MILEGSSIEGKNYFAYSDANIHAYGATPCVLFNKELLASFQLGDIYKIVTDGKWTFDAMSTMIQTVTGDLNGDGVITKDDRLGYWIRAPFLRVTISIALPTNSSGRSMVRFSIGSHLWPPMTLSSTLGWPT